MTRAEVDRHLGALRRLLASDSFTGSDWGQALGDLASGILRAVEADEALVAIWKEGWEGYLPGGRRLEGDGIGNHGSQTILDQVRRQLRPILVSGKDDLLLSSDSILDQQIMGFLAVPIFFWDAEAEGPERRFGGCLYVHRTIAREPFNRTDEAIMVDIARIAEPVLNMLRNVEAMQNRIEESEMELRDLRREAARDYRFGAEGMLLPREVHRTLSRIVHNDRVALLLSGPTGSGKTHLARTYHYASPRGGGPFVVFDCGSVTSPETLAAELFGYAPSSGYANAPAKGSPGKAALANGGTLFIDEVANLDLTLQPKLLRLIQDGKYSPLGSSRDKTTDIQIIAATNADLLARIEAGTFREDLYHRLAVVSVELPGLDDRADEIPGIARVLLEKLARESGRRPVSLSAKAERALISHRFARDGNIRGLENLLRRSLWASPKTLRRLDTRHLRWQDNPRRTRDRRSDEFDKVVAAIRAERNARRAAEVLGLSYRQLYWRLQKGGVTVRDVLAGRC